MVALYNAPQLKPFVVSEAPGQLSRENIVVTLSGAAVKSGQLLTQSGDTAATGSFAVDAGKTGNPTAGTINAGAAAKPGAYKIRFTGATTFEVEDPDGVLVDTGTTGVAFNKGGLSFTLTAGGTPAVAGTTATITVAEGTKKYIPYTAAGAAGPADAVLYAGLPAGTGDFRGVGIVRHAELNRFELTNLDAAGEADLAKRGIRVRSITVPKISTPAL